VVESAVVQEIRMVLRTPEATSRAIAAAQQSDPGVDTNDIVIALSGFDELWASLFPLEQARIAWLLVQRVTVNQAGLM
jgi:hypothetical protein